MSQEYRKNAITSSDARAIVTGDYKRLYEEKKGLREQEDLSGNFKVAFGAYVEPFHLDWLEGQLKQRDASTRWSKYKEGGNEQHRAEYGHHAGEGHYVQLISTPDALVNFKGETFPVEAKHTGRFSQIEDAADFYMPQLQHHLLVWGCDQLCFSVIFGNEEPRHIWIGRSKAWQEDYLLKCETFWGYMRADITPPPLFPGKEGSAEPYVPQKLLDSVPHDGMTRRDVTRDNQFKAIAGTFVATKDAVKRHEQAKKDLKAMMADTERELYSDVLTLKRDKRGAIRITIHEEAA